MELNQNCRFEAVLMDQISHENVTVEPLNRNPRIAHRHNLNRRLNRKRRAARFEANNRPNCVFHRTLTLSRMVCLATSMPKFI